MGRLVDGEWRTEWYDTAKHGGRFVRPETRFRGALSSDGSTGFPAEDGRYHLYVSYACPWAHRTLIARARMGLEDRISVSAVHPFMGDDGWSFDDDFPDHEGGRRFLREVYTDAEPRYTGRVTVPVLWDRQTRTIVSNESSEIIRMFDAAFEHGDDPWYPEDLRPAIDAVNAEVYPKVNNGVYRAGFATTQEAYEEAVTELFDTLEALEDRLRRQPWLAGDRRTEADWRLFTTLIRFDSVYHGHFKCNLRRIVDLPALWAFTRRLYQAEGVAPTVRLDQCKAHYYRSHPSINPTRIVPAGPLLDLDAPPPAWRPRA